MKQPKKLTRELKEAVAAYGLAVEQWSFFGEVTECYVKIIHKRTNQIRIIDKYARKVQKR